jgi:hypothetical protein
MMNSFDNSSHFAVLDNTQHKASWPSAWQILVECASAGQQQQRVDTVCQKVPTCRPPSRSCQGR